MDFKKHALAQLECVRVIAKEKGYTDQWLADKMELSRPNVTRMLSGKHIPKLDTFMMLCKVVGVPLGDICKKEVSQ